MNLGKAGKNTREPTRTTKTAQKGIDFPPDENLLLSGTSTETDGEFKAEDIPFGSDILLKDDKAIPKKRVTGYCVAEYDVLNVKCGIMNLFYIFLLVGLN